MTPRPIEGNAVHVERGARRATVSYLIREDSTRTLVLVRFGMSSAGWTDDATRALLSLWSEHNIQDQLDGVKRNSHIYAKLASDLSEMGHEFTAKQCRTKVKNLTQSYRKVK